MKVKAIMKEMSQIMTITSDMTIAEALTLIEENHLLSLPATDQGIFIGVISKTHIFEVYFLQEEMTKEEFLSNNISFVLESAIDFPLVDENTTIEEASSLFIATKFRFIPVVGRNNLLLGIITQQAIFKQYQKLYGTGFQKLIIYTYDYKGTLAKISELVARMGGDIKNMVVSNTDTMGLQEFFLRVDSPDFQGLIRALEKKGFDVRVPDAK